MTLTNKVSGPIDFLTSSGSTRPFPSTLKIRHFDSIFLQRLAGVQYGMVLNLGGDNVFFRSGRGFNDAADGQIVAFGASTGENDLVRLCANQLSHLLTGSIQSSFGLLTKSVNAGGVSIGFTDNTAAWPPILRGQLWWWHYCRNRFFFMISYGQWFGSTSQAL